MPAISKQYANVPIDDLGLKPRVYKHLCSLNVMTLEDLFNVPEPILMPYLEIILEGIERVKRDHAPPNN